jgi:signal transduction histidine kinase
VDLEALLEELVAQLRTLATERGAAISFTGGQPVMIYGDRFRLRQIFMNLVDNALKYTPYGEEVRVVLEQDSSRARITIADVGPGIAEKDIPFIFDRFYRVDEARNRAQGGTGLGLALVRSFTEAHGGTVEVKSRPGQGTVFTVFLPLSSP